MENIELNWDEILQSFEGDFYTDETMRRIHATDASVYREIPLAVARPRSKADLLELIRFARNHKISLIPRAAGTSLAGQVVGNGIIVDVGKYMNHILEINPEEKWIRVEPGVILDEMNKILKPLGLFFAPETSTSNRCMIGGMVGNNSCGAHSLIYGSTRDHLLEIKAILSDGSEAEFKNLSSTEFMTKLAGNQFENILYRQIYHILSDPENQNEIRKEYPDPSVHRRNTGYAIDSLLQCQPFVADGPPFNFCRLIAGSEGTLALITEIKLKLVPLPPSVIGLVCVHLNSVRESLFANLIALKHHPTSVELMDKTVLNLTRENREQDKNRFFVEGDPGAILIVEFAEKELSQLKAKVEAMQNEMMAAGYGYSFPLITGKDIQRVWALRKAGLGVLSNMPGDAKPVPVIEDTAVNPQYLPSYIEEFDQILHGLNLSCVYYAHIGSGELHLRPVLNLKDPADVKRFREVAVQTALLVKKYRGSLSGEHGDGRLRGEFIPLMIGQHNYELLKEIKTTWDPDGIFNVGKIIDTPPMDTSLRYEPGKSNREINTIFDFSKDQGILRAAERCNGSGDCRKTEITGGTMCPSYMATRDENASTRARANMLREMLTNSQQKNPFDHKELYEIMDLCLSCKACKSECPSNVDIAKLKAEFLQHYYDAHGIPLRTWAVANISSLYHLGSLFPGFTNFLFNNNFTSSVLKRILNFAPQRKIQNISGINIRKQITRLQTSQSFPNGRVYFFKDEFTSYTETDIVIKAIMLLNRLGYEVIIPRHKPSGRSYISKGLIRKAQKIAISNILMLKDLITEKTPLIGIEPSAILSFRDEYPELCGPELKEDCLRLASHCLMIDEFIDKEFKAGRIKTSQFTNQPMSIKLHGHCQQKAVASTQPTISMLSIPKNYKVEEIPSGCCGMAGSFGFEKEHYDLSQKVGELILFPEIRNTAENIKIAAVGTSCRNQIFEGTGRRAFHPLEILWDSLV